MMCQQAKLWGIAPTETHTHARIVGITFWHGPSFIRLSHQIYTTTNWDKYSVCVVIIAGISSHLTLSLHLMSELKHTDIYRFVIAKNAGHNSSLIVVSVDTSIVLYVYINTFFSHRDSFIVSVTFSIGTYSMLSHLQWWEKYSDLVLKGTVHPKISSS